MLLLKPILLIMYLLSWPDIPKSTIYDVMIQYHMKLWFTVGWNITALSLITHLPDQVTP
jgi:hypothetical protein